MGQFCATLAERIILNKPLLTIIFSCQAAGALELNANNSEDIQREAAATRRARLLRALTNQYVA